MPLCAPSLYRPPFFLVNAHFQTVYPHFFRRVKGVPYRRQRILTPDEDFLDLDVSSVRSRAAAIIAHGLEGNSGRSYVLGMVRALNRSGWDAVVWNFRGCSGEPNRKLRSYHSGDTADLHTVLEHVAGGGAYERIALVGFSLGGNVILKYLGERGAAASTVIHCAVAFSVPCDLKAGAEQMARPMNFFYMKRFLNMLHQKIRIKMERFPGRIDDQGFGRIRSFRDFDERYTAPLHGFAGAEDYWLKASSRPFLPLIRVPTLLVNALDDPFLAPACYPYEEARSNPYLFLETPAHGGHVGFVSFNPSGHYWSEIRTLEFLRNRR